MQRSQPGNICGNTGKRDVCGDPQRLMPQAVRELFDRAVNARRLLVLMRLLLLGWDASTASRLWSGSFAANCERTEKVFLATRRT